MKNTNNQSGMSIISVLIGLAILGIFVRVVASVADNSMQSAKIIRALNESEDVRNFIRIRTNCGQTKTKNGTKKIKFLYDKSGQPITKVDSEFMYFDKWKLRITSYSAANGAFGIEASHPDRQGAPQEFFKVAPFTCK